MKNIKFITWLLVIGLGIYIGSCSKEELSGKLVNSPINNGGNGGIVCSALNICTQVTGNTINITCATGGLAPYTYALIEVGGGSPNYTSNTSFSNLDLGDYWVYAKDANECHDSTMITITPIMGSFIDSRDGNTYNTVQIGSQIWMADNLRYNASGSWLNPSHPNALYGRLYDWHTVMDGSNSSTLNPSGVQGICPSGWHLPSDDEWNELEISLGLSSSDAMLATARGTHGKGMKSITGWLSSIGTNGSGFNVFPAGMFTTTSYTFGWDATYWTATEYSSLVAWFRRFEATNTAVRRHNSIKDPGFSCRCVKGITPCPTITFSALDNGNGSVTISNISGGQGPYTYAATSGGGTPNYTSNSTISGLIAGSYSIHVKDANGCEGTSVINIATNPCSGITISFTGTNSANGEITISGVSGGTVPYTYSIDGVNFQASSVFTGLSWGVSPGGQNYTVYAKDANGCINSQTVNVANPCANLTFTATNSNVGEITISNVSGGQAPFTYAAIQSGTPSYTSSNIFSGLSTGTYIVYLKDANNCVDTQSVYIPCPPITFNVVDNGDGSITINNVLGGQAPYLYAVSINGNFSYGSSNTISGLWTGTHIVHVKDANNCVDTQSVSITVPCPTITFDIINNGNGSITISNASGGQPNYMYALSQTGSPTYTFSNTITGITTGVSYTLYVKDAYNCVETIPLQLFPIGTFTDSRDNEVYATVTIGSKIWMAENLRFNAAGSYLNSSNPSPIYGRLYPWSVLMAGAPSSSSVPSGVQGVCPNGWHVPSNPELIQLTTAIGGTDIGTAMKSLTGWSFGLSTNLSSFNAFPAGAYFSSSFNGLGTYTFFWSTTESSGTQAWNHQLLASLDNVQNSFTNKTSANSCRCVKD